MEDDNHSPALPIGIPIAPPGIGDNISDWPVSTDVLPITETEPSLPCKPIRADLAVRACELLVAAYRRGLADGAEVEWEDLDEAAALAAEAVGADLNEPLEGIANALPVPAGDAQTTIAQQEIPEVLLHLQRNRDISPPARLE